MKYSRQNFEAAIESFREGVRGLAITDPEKEEMIAALTELLSVAEELGRQEAKE